MLCQFCLRFTVSSVSGKPALDALDAVINTTREYGVEMHNAFCRVCLCVRQSVML